MRPDGHKWFDGSDAGTTTDDTQLSIAVLQSILETGDFDMASQAKHLVLAFDETQAGWGSSTKESARRLKNGVNWRESGKTTEARRGTGNGVVMRSGPLALWYLAAIHANDYKFNQALVDFSAMTHYTKLSALATIIHVHALIACLNKQPDEYDPQWDLVDLISSCFDWKQLEHLGEKDYYSVDHLEDGPDDLEAQMFLLDVAPSWTASLVEKFFGGGSCYVYNSLPFSYVYFMCGPTRVHTLYQLVNAGGDADTNASIVGAMIGALNGMEIFEHKNHKHLLTGLACRDQLIALADEFCKKFSVT